MISELVDSATILPGLEASTKEAALKELLQAALDAEVFPKKRSAALKKRLNDREAMGSTGLGNGVAVPHFKHDDVTQSSVVVARAGDGIEWEAIDGEPVTIMFLVMSPTADPDSHLQCLRWISTLARNGDFRRFFLGADGQDQMRDLLRELLPKS
ncbi:MAG: PTS sugar transporter subunit IIA [Planctomycetota bacterium]|nr:PTS sugar transporter subunit IIA [Planctomycetota bacterium]